MRSLLTSPSTFSSTVMSERGGGKSVGVGVGGGGQSMVSTSLFKVVLFELQLN